MHTRFYLFIAFTMLALTSIAQNGSIKGVVQSKQDSTAIWGASVYIEGTVYSSYTEEDGSFILSDVAPGVYNVSCEDFTTGDSSLTRNVQVVAGKETFINVGIGISVKIGEVIEIVYEQPKAESVEGALEEEKVETKVTTIVSAEEFKSKGDSKVADAAKRASGVTVEGGKYVYVRGLSDRYSKTLLDGTEIPGLDPNRNAVQLDMFPTSFVQSLKVIKTFSPDLPGDFAGGLVDIRTRTYPEKFELSLTGGMKYNKQASFNDQFLTATKSKTDWLGYDDGQRSIPTSVNTLINEDDFPNSGTALISDEEADKIENLMDALNNEMTPTRTTSGTPYSFGFTVGNTHKISKRGDSLGLQSQLKIRYLVGLNYRNSISYFDNGTSNVYDLAGSLTEKSELNGQRIMTSESASQEVLIGGLAKLGVEFNKNNQIDFGYLKNQSGKQTASYAEGLNVDEGFTYRSRQIAYLERSMDNFIVSGNHVTSLKLPLKINWTGAYTLSSQDEPDLRFFNDNLDDNGNPEFRDQNYTGPVRYYRSMTETNMDGKLNLALPIALDETRDLVFKAGGSMVYKNRLFNEKRIDYSNGPEAVYDGNVETFLSDANTGFTSNNPGVQNGIGVYVVNQSNPKNNYNGISIIGAGYGLAEWPITKNLNVVTGARYEVTDITLSSEKVGEDSTTLISNNLLPSINLSYSLINGKKVSSKKDTSVVFTRDMKLRASFNQTLARPNFRELAPFAVEDFVNTSLVVGNPNLLLTEVLNYDIRWEYYPKAGEQVSVAAFYKDFTNPIEQITSPAAANIEYTWVNNAKGRLYGVEFELRKKLDVIHESLSNFALSGNLTLVKSSSDIDTVELSQIRGNDPDHATTRPLFGQSPYIINSTLSYSNDSARFKVNVAFNMFGERLVLVTRGGLPDIYELPRPSMGINVSKEVGKGFKITFRAKNIFNPDYKQVYKVQTESSNYLISTDNEDFVYRNYKRGRTYSLSISYKF